MSRSADSPEDDYIASTGRPRAAVVREIEADEQAQERRAPIDVDFLRRQRVHHDETDELVRDACLADEERDRTRQALAEMALSAVLEVTAVALRNSADVDAGALELPELVEALNRLRGEPNGGPGLISQLQMIQRDIENAIVAKLPKATKGRRAEAGQPEKWTVIDGFKLEHSTAGQWEIDSTTALTRLFSDVPQLTPAVAADIVTTHIGSLDTSWRVTELEESLGGAIVTEEPEVDDNGPVLYKSGPRKGEPKMRKITKNRIVALDLGDRKPGRDTIRVHLTEEATDAG